MNFNEKEMQFIEKCPRCQSMSCTTDLSSDEQKTKCNSCGHESGINSFRDHEKMEKPQPNGRLIDNFGRRGMKDPEEVSRRIQLLKGLDINL